ncbi:MAG: TlpA disulfide reductase family protein [Bacteroidaceae bacterium]|nr:TlpA disulfide reductase family protein [Bacteroidaceae bacterium]
MKKLVYSLLAVSFLFGACNTKPTNSFTVEGITGSAMNGDIIYLQKEVNKKLTSIDSTYVKENKFTFKGDASQPDLRFILHKKGTRSGVVAFFTEAGTVKVDLTSDQPTIGGTTSNTAFQLFQDSVSTLRNKMTAYIEMYKNTGSTEEQKEEAKNGFNSLQEEHSNFTTRTIKSNLSNILGAFLLESNSYIMESNEIDSLLQKIDQRFLSRPGLVKLAKRIEDTRKTQVGQMFSDIVANTPQDKMDSLSNYAGKGNYVLVDFWASWCGPCREEMPNLVNLYKKYHAKGFEVVGISLDQEKKSWVDGLKKLEMTWPQLSDLKGWECKGAQTYGVRSIPHTVLISPEGKIIKKNLRGEELEKELATLYK